VKSIVIIFGYRLGIFFYIGLITVILSQFTGCSHIPQCHIKEEPFRKISRIAIMSFADAPGADAGRSGQVVAGQVVNAAMKRSDWQVVERHRIDAILKEHELQLSGIVDTSTAVKVGKVLGVDGVIVGSVSQYEIGSIPFLFFIAFDQNVYRVGFNLRLISVKTGEVCWTASASKSSLISLEDCARKAADGLIEDLNKKIHDSSVLNEIPVFKH